MPKLRCSAQACIHNNQECCCRGEIQVSGQGADHSEETCCSNFYEDIGNARNVIQQEQTVYMDVTCEAENCTHNVAYKCQADYIDVSGYSACKCDETCCSSFKPQE
ncbi:MAG: DUF1540 domain-containing protein [Cellulosilyticum sp.]|nr:DUF1540 domain-containing protein [Cellulosilyticum sp.]